jgi:hypothetical protein
MPVQGRIHLIDRAAMISGDLCHTLVDELVVVHDASLPLPARFANTTSPQACKAELGILSWTYRYLDNRCSSSRYSMPSSPPCAARVLERMSVQLAVHEERWVNLLGQRCRAGLLHE